MRLKVLVVEDDTVQADILVRMLQSQSCYVETVGDGRNAVRRLQSLLFDVALIDYRLPEIDGLGIATVLRETIEDASRPVLIGLTAYADVIRLEAARGGAGFDALCSKPPEIRALMVTIHDCLDDSPRRRLTMEQGAPERIGSSLSLGAGPAAEPSTSVSTRILLADDDPDLARLLHHVFTEKGYVVDVAENGLEAIRLVRTQRFDVVVMDYNMPELNGLAAAKVIYDGLNELARPRLIALTSAPDELTDSDPKWNMVFDEVVSKLSGADAILTAVQKWLSYAAYRGDAAAEVVDFPSLIRLVDAQHGMGAGRR